MEAVSMKENDVLQTEKFILVFYNLFSFLNLSDAFLFQA